MDCSRLLTRLAAASAFLFVVSVPPMYAQGQDEYIVQFQEGTTAATRSAAAANAGASVRRLYNNVSAASIHAPNDQALAALMRNPRVVSIVPNRPVSAYQSANAPGGKKGGGTPPPPTSSQIVPAGVTRVGVATSVSNGAGVGVAIVDTGIDLVHGDLSVAPQRFTAHGTSCQDGNGHGTHVAGIVAASDNTRDVIGVAPAAKLYCVRVLDNSGSGSDADVMAGLDWVLTNGSKVTPAIKVINMSLGRPGSVDDNPAMRDLVSALDAAGMSVVVAAGNDPYSEVSGQIPAAYPQVIAVASTTAVKGSNQCARFSGFIGADTASYFTTDGPEVTVSAPGEEREDINAGCFINSTGILSTKLGGGTTRMSGTSMAAPHVAGIAARYYQPNLAVSPSYVKGRIVDTAYRQTPVPQDSPTTAYTFDGIREGIAQAP